MNADLENLWEELSYTGENDNCVELPSAIISLFHVATEFVSQRKDSFENHLQEFGKWKKQVNCVIWCCSHISSYNLKVVEAMICIHKLLWHHFGTFPANIEF